VNPTGSGSYCFQKTRRRRQRLSGYYQLEEWQMAKHLKKVAKQVPERPERQVVLERQFPLRHGVDPNQCQRILGAIRSLESLTIYLLRFFFTGASAGDEPQEDWKAS
jgi:hypothetical protein